MTARTRRPAVRRSMMIAAAAVVGLAANTTARSAHASAFPHLKFLRSSPSADTTVANSPDAVRIWLSEPAELPATKIVLTGAKGDTVATAPLTRGTEKDAPVVAKLVKPVGAGVYTVTWKAMSKDGHVVDGTFKFHVGSAK